MNDCIMLCDTVRLGHPFILSNEDLSCIIDSI